MPIPKKNSAPVKDSQDFSQWASSHDSPKVSEKKGQAAHDAKNLFMEPDRVVLHDGNKDHGDPEPYQETAGAGHLQPSRHAEKDRAHASHQVSCDNGCSGPQCICYDTGRDLHQGIDGKIDGRQDPQTGTVDVEVCHEKFRDHPPGPCGENKPKYR